MIFRVLLVPLSLDEFHVHSIKLSTYYFDWVVLWMYGRTNCPFEHKPIGPNIRQSRRGLVAKLYYTGHWKVFASANKRRILFYREACEASMLTLEKLSQSSISRIAALGCKIALTYRKFDMVIRDFIDNFIVTSYWVFFGWSNYGAGWLMHEKQINKPKCGRTLYKFQRGRKPSCYFKEVVNLK